MTRQRSGPGMSSSDECSLRVDQVSGEIDLCLARGDFLVWVKMEDGKIRALRMRGLDNGALPRAKSAINEFFSHLEPPKNPSNTVHDHHDRARMDITTNVHFAMETVKGLAMTLRAAGRNEPDHPEREGPAVHDALASPIGDLLDACHAFRAQVNSAMNPSSVHPPRPPPAGHASSIGESSSPTHLALREYARQRFMGRRLGQAWSEHFLDSLVCGDEVLHVGESLLEELQAGFVIV